VAGAGLGLQGTTFRVSPSYQLPQGCDSAQIAKWNGSAWTCAADDTASYQNAVIVAKSGGDYTTISAALTSITTASATNHYLVKVMPGVYTETVTMKQYVDIEGAGELATTITRGGSSALGSAGTVIGANNAELRFLTVVNTGGNTFAVAIYNDSDSPRLTHVTALASGATTNNYGVYNSSSSPTMTSVTATASGGSWSYGVYNTNSSSPTMTNVTAIGSGGTNSVGVYINSSSPTMTNVTATGLGGTYSYGVYANASSLTIQNSIISASGGTNNIGIKNYATSGSYTVTLNNSQVTGSTNTIINHSEFTTRVGASLLDGGAVNANGGTVTCAGVYDEAYAFYASTCP
jgi:hypothetical protein